MAIYLLNPLIADPTPINNAVEKVIEATDRYRLQANKGWLIAYSGTSVELSNHIGLTGQPEGSPNLGSAIIVPFSSYYGRGPTEMWEWLKTRFER